MFLRPVSLGAKRCPSVTPAASPRTALRTGRGCPERQQPFFSANKHKPASDARMNASDARVSRSVSRACGVSPALNKEKQTGSAQTSHRQPGVLRLHGLVCSSRVFFLRHQPPPPHATPVQPRSVAPLTTPALNNPVNGQQRDDLTARRVFSCSVTPVSCLTICGCVSEPSVLPT